MRNIYLLYIRRMLSTLLCLAICTTFSISAHADAYTREHAVSRNTRSVHTQTQCVKLMDWPVRHPEVLQDFDAPDKPWLAGHRGVDLASHEGDELIAPAAGYISFAGKVAGKDVVVITHPQGFRSTFEPAQAVARQGQALKRGEVFALRSSGESNHCEDTCIHWGVKISKQRYLNPQRMIEASPIIILHPRE